jgi:hypothetical protein
MKLNLLLLSAAAMVSAANASHAPVDLGTAANYVILAQTGISTVPQSAITGDIAVYDYTSTAITGFTLSLHSSGVHSTSTQLTGMSKAYAADYGTPTPENLIAAVGDMQNAYNDAADLPNDSDTSKVNLKAGLIGGETLGPGVYTFDTAIDITSDVTFDGGADSNAVFIIRTTGNLLQAAGKSVILSNGAKAQNIFWQVAGKVSMGAGAHMEGVLLVKTLVAMVTGSSLNGRILAQTAVTLDSATIVEKKQGAH